VRATIAEAAGVKAIAVIGHHDADELLVARKFDRRRIRAAGASSTRSKFHPMSLSQLLIRFNCM
jgi:hypothetical protein